MSSPPSCQVRTSPRRKEQTDVRTSQPTKHGHFAALAERLWVRRFQATFSCVCGYRRNECCLPSFHFGTMSFRDRRGREFRSWDTKPILEDEQQRWECYFRQQSNTPRAFRDMESVAWRRQSRTRNNDADTLDSQRRDSSDALILVARQYNRTNPPVRYTHRRDARYERRSLANYRNTHRW